MEEDVAHLSLKKEARVKEEENPGLNSDGRDSTMSASLRRGLPKVNWSAVSGTATNRSPTRSPSC